MYSVSNRKILWVGPILNPKSLFSNKAASAAANSWQISFINALHKSSADIKICSYVPERVFPLGKLLPHCKEVPENLNLVYVRYVNLPFIRHLTLGISLIWHLRKLKHDDVITYNSSLEHTLLGLFIKAKGKGWLNIAADDGYSRFANSNVFLSYSFFKKVPFKYKIHIDGGISRTIRTLPNVAIKKIIIYSGGWTKWTGIEDFVKTFIKINHQDFHLHIYGVNPQIKEQLNFELNDKVKFKGFVSVEQLEAARKEAFAFVNPRPKEVVNGDKNFPSKLLEYLQYCKPILSTRTPSLAPYYDELLFYYDPEIEHSLSASLQLLNSLQVSDLDKLADKIYQFSSSYTWEKQAQTLLEHIRYIGNE